MNNNRREQFTIIQHNVQNWTFQRRNELSNIYKELDPDVILINSHCRRQQEKIKLFNYNVHQRNYADEDHAGAAIAIRKDIKYKIIDDFDEDFLAIELESNRGNFVVGTAYMPPRRNYFPNPDIMRILRRNIPAYIIGDLNARHPSLGQQSRNPMGTGINNLIHQEKATFMGPDFKTWIGPIGTGTPDIMIGNKNIHMNYSITQGPLTSSDHLPLIIRLSTKAITIPKKKTLL